MPVFPPRLTASRALMRELCTILEEGRRDAWYAFVHLSESTVSAARVDRAAEGVSVDTDRGIVLRVVAGARSFEHATNDLDPTSLRDAARALRRRVEGADLDPAAPVYTPLSWDEERLDELHPAIREQILSSAGAPLGPGVPVHFTVDADIADPAHLLAEARSNRDAVRAADGQNALAGVWGHAVQAVRIAVFVDRCKDMSQALITSQSRAFGVTRGGGGCSEVNVALGSIDAARIRPELLAGIPAIAVGLEGATRIAPGRYKIITGPEVTGVLAHEAFGHTQEGDTRVLGRSCATDLEATARIVGAPGATIVNDAGVFAAGDGPARTNGSYFFDDEGQLARPHVILEDGRVTGPMNDLLSSLIGDRNGRAPRQANGRRESWRRPVFARQSNTYFTPGDHTLDDLVAMVDRGFLAERAGGGMEDPKGMSLAAGAVWLEEIVDGKRTGRMFVGPQGGSVELSDPVADILTGLVAKTAHYEVLAGGCQKYHKENVNAGIGGPYILWEGIQCG